MIIGVTTTYTNKDDYAIERVTVAYLRSIERAGGVPVLLPTQANDGAAAEMIGRIDGLVLTGGGDIDPGLYTSEPVLDQVAYVSRKRDLFEMELARTAYDLGMPTLGICRGMQVMNVAFGGSLVQDLAACGVTDVEHMQQPPFDDTDQNTVIVPETKLSALFGGKASLAVNSMHHQAICELAPNFRISARSSDGVIEGIEDPSQDFYLGVQWHPEYLADNGALFEAFCNRVAAYRAD